MKCLFSFVFVFLFLFPNYVFSKTYNATYKIKTNGFVIGSLDWNLNKNTDAYFLNIDLKSKGALSLLFSFKGMYKARGKIVDNKFVVTNYSQSWKTNKKGRDVEISFKNNGIKTLSQFPKETESLRIELSSLSGHSDPLTSFIKLLSGSKESKTIDGRRVYTFKLVEEKENRKKYITNDFSNLWADHKRNGLEYISFEEGDEKFIPQSIYLSFKGRTFKVLLD